MDQLMYKDIVQHVRLPFAKRNKPRGWTMNQNTHLDMLRTSAQRNKFELLSGRLKV
jgi:hypothetical protein